VKGELKGTTEKTKTDRLRERQKKKKEKRIKRKEKDQRQRLVEKMNPGLGNKYSKEKALRELDKESKAVNSRVTVLKVGARICSLKQSSRVKRMFVCLFVYRLYCIMEKHQV